MLSLRTIFFGLILLIIFLFKFYCNDEVFQDLTEEKTKRAKNLKIFFLGVTIWSSISYIFRNNSLVSVIIPKENSGFWLLLVCETCLSQTALLPFDFFVKLFWLQHDETRTKIQKFVPEHLVRHRWTRKETNNITLIRAVNKIIHLFHHFMERYPMFWVFLILAGKEKDLGTEVLFLSQELLWHLEES